MGENGIVPRTITVERNLGEDMIASCWVRNNRSSSEGDYAREFTNDRHVSVLSEKNDLAMQLESYVKNAKELICVSSYLIQGSAFTDALLAASKRGVRCYVLTSREDELKADPDEMDGKGKEIIDEHKRLLDSLAGSVLVRTAPHFHAKFALFDPTGDEPLGILSTCNLTVDAMKGKNVELALTMTPEEVRSVFNQFVHGFWTESRHELMAKGTLSAIARKDVVSDALDYVNHPCTVGSKNGLQELVHNIMRSAKRSLTIGSWTIEPDHLITKAIEAAAQKGVKVTVLTRPKEVNTLTAIRLAKHGARIVGIERFHAKLVIADGRDAIVMTANISKKGMDEGFEAGVRLSEADSKKLDAILRGMADSSEWTYKDQVQIKEIEKGPVKRWNEKAKVLQEVQISDQLEQKSESVIVALADLQTYQQDKAVLSSPNTGDVKIIYRTVRRKVTVSPNALPNDAVATEVLTNGMVMAKGPKGELYVPVAYQEDIEPGSKAAGARSATLVFATEGQINELKRKLAKGSKGKGKK
jgi:phosphatidylserine/phosphatidylglycerophosphate/cardiolipin synthase-like enzyme